MSSAANGQSKGMTNQESNHRSLGFVPEVQIERSSWGPGLIAYGWGQNPCFPSTLAPLRVVRKVSR